MEVVHDDLKFLGHPVNHRDSILFHFTVVQEHISAEVMLEDVAPMLLFKLRQGLPLLVVLSLSEENGQVGRDTLEEGRFRLVIVVINELIHDFCVRVRL